MLYFLVFIHTKIYKIDFCYYVIQIRNKRQLKMESLLYTAIESSHDAKITNSDKRSFKLAHRVNCNWEILKNTNIKKKLETIMKKMNIQDYNIEKVDNSYEFGYELIVDEQNYRKMYESISSS